MTISNILFLLGLFLLVFYDIYLLIFHSGLRKDESEPNYRKSAVSVVVAARNEEQNIGRLLTSLINQSYPQELYEIIIANDRSNDKTAQIIEDFCSKWTNIRLVNIESTPEGISPKKFALSRAIEESQNEIILLTDADCLVTKYWIEAMVSKFSQKISMVAGFSRTQLPNWKKSSILHRFEFFDFLLMFMAAAGAILSGKYFSCSNQNLAYRRQSFYQVGGFEKIKHLLSGDDVNLLQLFRKKNLKVTFSLIGHSFVYTQPVKSFSHLISQRSRWASNSKWQLALNPEFFIYLVIVFSLHLVMLILLFLSWQTALLLFAGKFVSEFIFVALNFTKFESERGRLTFFPVWAIIQPFYLIFVAFRGLFDFFSWK
jgi:cellulose synthase/poly-beta-1,6-N-acetylglucosamine synthase-like glycosyltransferase